MGSSEPLAEFLRIIAPEWRLLQVSEHDPLCLAAYARGMPLTGTLDTFLQIPWPIHVQLGTLPFRALQGDPFAWHTLLDGDIRHIEMRCSQPENASVIHLEEAHSRDAGRGDLPGGPDATDLADLLAL